MSLWASIASNFNLSVHARESLALRSKGGANIGLFRRTVVPAST